MTLHPIPLCNPFASVLGALMGFGILTGLSVPALGQGDSVSGIFPESGGPSHLPWHPDTDQPAPPLPFPPLDQIRPIPMPVCNDTLPQGPRDQGVYIHDASTGQTRHVPSTGTQPGR